MKKILVIEDEQDIRLHIVKILQYEGYHAIDAENGRIGVQRARQEHPDLIICDVLMPQLNGYGVLTALRQNPLTAAIPFIFLTAKTTQNDIRKGMSLGADDYLTKPFKVTDLLAAVKTRLEKHTLISKTIDDAQFTLSHALPEQFQTPLNAIIGFAEFLIHFAPDLALELEEVVEMQRPVLENALELKRLIENYLLYARLKLLQYEPETRHEWDCHDACDTRILIETTIAEKAEQWHRYEDIHLELIEKSLQIPEKNFQKIVEELCGNACKYSEKGTPIAIVTSLEDGQFVLKVSDRGCGMTEEAIARCRQGVHDAEAPYDTQPGLGLGLSIVRLLSELYGGTLHMKSTPDEGTQVSVSFA